MKQQCQQAAQEILQFLEERSASAPASPPTSNPWHATSFERMRYNAETVAVYHTRFSARVRDLCGALQEAGCPRAEFEMVLRPSNTPAAIRAVADKLGGLADQLR
ncbi:MAG: hypothetical protein VST65_03635 [Nitrospirota bacterium]|nr:hypothetical protein [Nitrospirota bacterium]